MLKYYFFILMGLYFLPSPSLAQENSGEDKYEVIATHPRLVFSKEEEFLLQLVFLESELSQKLKEDLQKDADALLDKKALKFEIDKDSSYYTFRKDYFNRVITLSLAYRIFEDSKYADAASNLLFEICSKDSWYTRNFVDAAEILAATAIGYDWLYYFLDREKREVVRNAIVIKGLRPGIAVLKDGVEDYGLWPSEDELGDRIICAGSMVMGGLSVADMFPELKNQAIYYSLTSIKDDMKTFDVDHLIENGAEDWTQTNTYLGMFMTSLNSSLGHDFGISLAEGIKASAEKVHNIFTGSQKSKYGDEAFSPSQFWFSKSFDLPDLAMNQRRVISDITPSYTNQYLWRKQFFYLNLAWFDNAETLE